MNSKSPTVEAILKEKGPCLTSQVCKELEASGIPPATARQRVFRVRHPVVRLSGLVFPRRAHFLFLESQRDSRAYWEALIREAQQSSPAYAAAIAGLLSRGGVVPASHFHIVCGSPLRQQGQISSGTILSRLDAAGLIKEIDVVGVGKCVSLGEAFFLQNKQDAALRARLLAEKVLLSAVKDWARKLGAASYESIRTRDDEGELPKVGTFAWDLTGPSYLRHMVRWGSTGKPKPGFLVCDLALGERFGEAAVAAFVRKCETLGGLKGLAPVWPILMADGFSREAFNAGRAHGVMMATPELLFGKQVADGLRQLVETLSRAASVAVDHPEAIEEIFGRLAQIEGAAANLRGALFEMLVGHCVTKVDGGSIDIGKKILDLNTGKRLDIDVFRVKGDTEVGVYECKGHQPAQIVSLEDVEHWLTERVAPIHKVLKIEDRLLVADFSYEYWTCGSFAPDAIARLEAAKANTRQYAIRWKDGPAIRQYASRIRNKAVLKMLDEHYFNHPIARTEKRYDARDSKEIRVDVPEGGLREKLQAL